METKKKQWHKTETLEWDLLGNSMVFFSPSCNTSRVACGRVGVKLTPYEVPGPDDPAKNAPTRSRLQQTASTSDSRSNHIPWYSFAARLGYVHAYIFMNCRLSVSVYWEIDGNGEHFYTRDYFNIEARLRTYKYYT